MSEPRLAALVLATGAVFGPLNAVGVCLPEDPKAGDTVVCIGVNSDGLRYDLPGLNLHVASGAVIPGAILSAPSNTVFNFGRAAYFSLGGRDYTLSNLGMIILTRSGIGPDDPLGAVEARVTGPGFITNAVRDSAAGVIETSGDYVAGILVRDPTGPVVIDNRAGFNDVGELIARASIFTGGTGAPGIYLVDDVGGVAAPSSNSISNAGVIETQGRESAAIALEPLFEEIPGAGVTRIQNLGTGTIVTSGEDAQGILAYGHDVQVTNAGGILTGGSFSAGVEAIGAGRVAVRNAAGASIATEGFVFSPGIAVTGEPPSQEASVVNAGSVLTQGSDSPGIVVAGSRHRVENSCAAGNACGSLISTTGDGSEGIQLGLVEPALGIDAPSTEGRVENAGAITTEGFFAPGIRVLGTRNLVTNALDGRIDTTGDGSDGVALQGPANMLMNLGDITTGGPASSGIFSTGSEVTVDHLDGVITTTGEGAAGIEVEGERAWANTHNGSRIVTTGRSAHGISVSGSEASARSDGIILTNGEEAHGIRLSSVDGSVTNGGTIDTIGARAAGIRVLSAPLGDQNVVRNSGNIATAGANADGVYATSGFYDISNSGGIATSGDNADGIEVGGSAIFRFGPENSVRNSGEISVSGASSVGVRLATLATEVATFTNEATGGVSSAGVAVAGGDGIDAVRNEGVINGDVQLGANNDVFARRPGSAVNGVVDGGDEVGGPPFGGDVLEVVFRGDEQLKGSGFVNFEQFTVGGIGRLTLVEELVVGSSTFAQGTVILAFNSMLDSSATVETGATVGGRGTVSGDLATNGGSVSPAESTGTLFVGGDFTLGGGAVVVEADSPVDRDLLAVDGNVTLNDGILKVILGYVPDEDDVLQFFGLGGAFSIGEGFDGILGFAALNSDVPIGTPFTVDLGGRLFSGTVGAVVPIPGALYLFTSALIGVLGVAGRGGLRAGPNRNTTVPADSATPPGIAGT